MARLRHLYDVLVALRSLLHNKLRGRDADRYAFLLQAPQDVLVVQVIPGLVAAECSASPVACAAKRVSHADIGAREHVGARAHGATHDHWLAGQLVVYWNERVVRRESPGGAFSMHEELHLLSIHHVLLDLRYVVGDVVYHEHVQIFGRLVEDLGEGLPREERHRGSVHPRVVGGRCHCSHVVLPLHRLDARTSQLPVVDLDVVAGHGTLHVDQRVRSDLVPEASASRVEHHTDLVLLVNAHLLCCKLIVDLFHHLDLCVVVPCSEGTHLWQPALLGAGRHL
mmetsp:Transcript_25413/g.69382  ORF Transcript_25413/g.69382 Transcript_25413/m.69382 type:complete len:282 (+) Transcript_25413:176-1021(+)